MATIAGAASAVKTFADTFPDMLTTLIRDNAGDLPLIIRAQLLAGQDGHGEPLRPTYTGDPYFQSDEAGRWKGKAEQYKRYKKRITPPNPVSWLGLPQRDENTPNLRITGMFHESIKTADAPGGVRLQSVDTPFASDIEAKYGGAIYRIGPEGRRWLWDNAYTRGIREYYRAFGLL